MTRQWVQAWIPPSGNRPWGWRWQRREKVVHMCPPNGSGLMPCCGLTPFERMADHITDDPEQVTCDARLSQSAGEQDR